MQAKVDELKILRLQIGINEMPPPALRDDDFIKRLKAKLARLQQRPILKLVPDRDA
jgi:hypothetical protein